MAQKKKITIHGHFMENYQKMKMVKEEITNVEDSKAKRLLN